MFNPWGLLFVVLGIVLVYVGIKGTQNNLYAFITGNRPTNQDNTPFAPSSSQGQTNTAPFNPNPPGHTGTL